ncbi:MAG: phage tail protein [Clostridia bacterium]|nr:phage tail protein [Clostridia bacterium]
MSVDSMLVAALTPFGFDVDNGVSFSKGRTYFAFNYTVIPADYADDAPCHERYLVQVHFFCPLDMNVTTLKKSVRQALFAAGFTWPAIVPDSDENGRHLIFECEIAEGVETDGADGD